MRTARVCCRAFLLTLALAPAALAAPPNPAFTDVTADSGLAKLLNEKCAADPKWWLSGVDLVDLDGDGKLDLFLGSHGGGHALAALNDGAGHFAAATGPYPDREIYLAADVNRDGKVDLMVTHNDGAGRWWINDSTPGKLAFRKTDTGADRARANAWIDLDRDGQADWLHEGNDGLVFELGDGAGAFRKGAGLPIVKSKNETNMIPVDLNGDGHIDLVAHWGRYQFPEGHSRVYLNDGKGNFTDATAACGLTEEGLAIKGVGDLNADGVTDLLAIERKRPVLFLNDGHGKFSRAPADTLAGMDAASKPNYASWGMAVVTDFDNDGVADILWNGRNFLWALRGTGGGNFEYANKTWGIKDRAAASVDDGLCFGDYDNDGDLDIIGYTRDAANGQRRLKLYRNDAAAPGNNWLNLTLTGAKGNREAAGAKIRVTSNNRLIAYEQVLIVGSQSAHSYPITNATQRHFGLAKLGRADVRVEFYLSGKVVEKANVARDVKIAEE